MNLPKFPPAAERHAAQLAEMAFGDIPLVKRLKENIPPPTAEEKARWADADEADELYKMIQGYPPDPCETCERI